MTAHPIIPSCYDPHFHPMSSTPSPKNCKPAAKKWQIHYEKLHIQAVL